MRLDTDRISKPSIGLVRPRPPKDSGGKITSFQAWIRERGRPVFKRVPSCTFLNSLLSAGRARIPGLTTIIMLPTGTIICSPVPRSGRREKTRRPHPIFFSSDVHA